MVVAVVFALAPAALDDVQPLISSTEGTRTAIANAAFRTISVCQIAPKAGWPLRRILWRTHLFGALFGGRDVGRRRPVAFVVMEDLPDAFFRAVQRFEAAALHFRQCREPSVHR